MNTQSYLLFVEQYDKKTYRWLQYQKSLKSKGLLPVDKCEKLEQLYAVDWKRKIINSWEENYFECKKIVDETGILPTKKENLRLYGWLSNQKIHKNNLTLDQICLLEQLPGFTLERKISTWEENYFECKKIVDETGILPTRKENLRLYGWLNYQKRHKNNLSDQKMDLLEQLPGFTLERKFSSWEENYFECNKIVTETGMLPIYKSHPRLYKWLEY